MSSLVDTVAARHPAIIRYSVEGNEPVRCFPGDDPDAQVRKPERLYSWRQPGTYTVELVFGTPKCVVIPMTLTIRVVEK